VDVTIDAEHFPLPNAADLTQLEPLGAANAEPLFFVREARVTEVGSVAGEHLKLELRVGSRTFRAFGYDMAAIPLQVGDDVRALGNLRPDTWLGGDRVELRLLEVEAH
jgi:single-stranded DNA-specific DHH superfamily exonuclease